MNYKHPWWPTLVQVSEQLENANIGYCWIEASALFAAGIDLPDLERLTVSIQWDQFPDALALYQEQDPKRTDEKPAASRLEFTLNHVPITIVCFYNTVVQTDPERVSVHWEGQRIWYKSLDYYLQPYRLSDHFAERIHRHYAEKQLDMSLLNRAAWNQNPYDAWVSRFGPPEEAAKRILQDPAGRLATFTPYLGDVAGKRVANLLGSHGSKAVALALLGASDVTVVDISEENARYANQLAAAAGVQIRYIVSDVLDLPTEELNGSYDFVLMELGVLHYFIRLEPLMKIVSQLLNENGRFILHDFHPVSTKLITSKGKKHKVTGNYFDKGLEFTEVAYSKHIQNPHNEGWKKAYLRKWTLGEIVTAAAQSGLNIRFLQEEPNTKTDDIGIPKTFTLIAEKSPAAQ